MKIVIILLVILILAAITYLLFVPSHPTPPTITPTLSPITFPTPLSGVTGTLSVPSLTPPPEVVDQNKLDYQFNDLVKSTVNQYPFITKLPIFTDHYTIIFDFETTSIRVRLINTTQAAVSAQVTQQLQSIGVDTTKIPVNYLP